MAKHRQVDEQMPYEVVIFEPLLGIDGCTDGIEDSARANQHKKWGRGVVPEEREEDDNHPAHNQVDGEADRRYRSLRQRFIKYAE